MNRLRRIAHRIVTAPARFEAWVDAQDDEAFFIYCDAMTPFIAVAVSAGLAGLCIAGAILHCLKP